MEKIEIPSNLVKLDSGLHILFLLLHLNQWQPVWFFFSPNSELKQGDPLSPFLFFLSSDVFSRLMFREQRAGNLKGMQIARNCPAIHHIPFADDLLIFGRANFTEATYQNLFG